MKKLTTLAVTAALVVSSQIAIVPDAQAFSFGSFNFSDNWGSGYRRYDPRWGRYPPPGYGGYGWNNVPPWERGFTGPRFNSPDRDRFGWGNRNVPRWDALPPPRWGAPPRWRTAPGFNPPAAAPQTPAPTQPPSR